MDRLPVTAVKHNASGISNAAAIIVHLLETNHSQDANAE